MGWILKNRPMFVFWGNNFLMLRIITKLDEYGGDIHNRSRIHIEVYQAIRKAVGEDYPVLIKLNCKDFLENGLSLDDSLHVGRMLADVGLDAIELSGGLLTGGKLSPSRPGIKSEEEVQGRSPLFQKCNRYSANPDRRYAILSSSRVLSGRWSSGLYLHESPIYQGT